MCRLSCALLCTNLKSILNSSPIDVLENWCLTGWPGAWAVQAKQGGSHGNPACRNPPAATTNWHCNTENMSVNNTYLSLYLPTPMDPKALRDRSQNLQRFALKKICKDLLWKLTWAEFVCYWKCSNLCYLMMTISLFIFGNVIDIERYYNRCLSLLGIAEFKSSKVGY